MIHSEVPMFRSFVCGCRQYMSDFDDNTRTSTGTGDDARCLGVAHHELLLMNIR